MNIILTAYLTSGKDGHKKWEPGRSDHREANYLDIAPLYNSIDHDKIAFVFIHDCFDELPFDSLQVKRTRKLSANAQRWPIFYDTLNGLTCDHIFLVDSTDVECYINPFNSDLGNFLWTGDEKHSKVYEPWMKTHQEPYVTMPDYQEVIYENRKHTLLNCGIIGGKREIVLEYLELMVKYQAECNLPDNISVDMAVHNYIIFKHFKDRFKHGVQVNTVFRKNEKPNGISWFRHK